MAGALIALRILGRTAATAAVVAVIAWSLVELGPGTTAERAAEASGLIGSGVIEDARERAAIAADVARHHGLDRGFATRMLDYLGDAARLDLGRSWRSDRSVRDALAESAPATLLLVGLALGLAVVLGLAAALGSARRLDTATDGAIAACAALAISTPPVWLALVASNALARGEPLSILPATGLGSATAVVLPVACLALVPAAVIARHGRAALVAAMGQPWAIAARARGLDEGSILRRHALRIAAPTLLALAPALVGYGLGAALVIERVFGIRGLGALTLDAAARGDAPVLVGASVIAAMLVALVAALADLAAGKLDPRRSQKETA